jgi:hypothetical protein
MCAHLWSWLAAAVQKMTLKKNVAQKRVERSPGAGENQRMSPRMGRAARHCSPFVCTKPWRVSASGSTWCSRKERMKIRPTQGVSGVPQVSQAQWTIPVRKSAPM